MLSVEIGSIVDFISSYARFRGIVFCISGEYAMIAVIGSSSTYSKLKHECVPVVDKSALLAILK
jgi:hypothetical protein